MWIVFSPPYYGYYYYEYQIVTVYPTLAIVGLIFMPSLFRESSFLQQANTAQRPEKRATILATRTARSRVSSSIALAIGVVTFFVPTTLVAYPSYYSSSTTLMSVVAFFSSTQNSYMPLEWFQASWSIIPPSTIVFMIALSAVRILFAKRIMLYYRGFGGAQRVLATGVAGEALTNSVVLVPFLLSGMTAGYLIMPLPFLLVVGVPLILLRDHLTSEEMMVPSTTEISRDEVWPLAFQEEGVTRFADLNVRPVSVKVPIAYIILSRIRDLRHHQE
jgi:hypothetical protein